jgi:hypothetical protein
MADGSGGGIFATSGSVRLSQSTITSNHARSRAGGIWNAQGTPTFLLGSIIADNTAVLGYPDLQMFVEPLTSHFSLIGNTAGWEAQHISSLDSGIGNISNLSALLGPLLNNGGVVLTHRPSSGSPTIDAGDPGFDPADPDGDPLTDDATPFDQRGAPFQRVVSGRIDIGAVERQPFPAALFGDYNGDNFVNAADYTVWRNASGQTGVWPYSGADGNGDGEITSADYLVWKQHYGETLELLGAGSTELEAASGAGEEIVAAGVRAEAGPWRSTGVQASSRSGESVSLALESQFGSNIGQALPDARYSVTRRLTNFPAHAKPTRWTLEPVFQDAALLAFYAIEQHGQEVRPIVGGGAGCSDAQPGDLVEWEIEALDLAWEQPASHS